MHARVCIIWAAHRKSRNSLACISGPSRTSVRITSGLNSRPEPPARPPPPTTGITLRGSKSHAPGGPVLEKQKKAFRCLVKGGRAVR